MTLTVLALAGLLLAGESIYQLDARFLRGSDDAVREVAAVLGIKYRRLSTGVINHSSIITLLDRAGGVDTRVEGLGQPATDLVQRLLARARAPRSPAKE